MRPVLVSPNPLLGGSWRRSALHAAFFVTVLLIVAAASFMASRGRIDWSFVLAGGVAVIGGVALYRLGRFEYGLLAVAFSAGLINFFALPTGRDSRIVISLAISLVLLGIWGLQLIFSRISGERIRPSPVNKPLLAFVLVCIMSYVWSLLMRDPLLYIWPSFPVVQIAALLVNIALPLMALLVANKVTETKWLKGLVGILMVIGVLQLMTELFRLPMDILLNNGTRGLFSMWLGAMACSLLLLHTRLSRWQRLMLGALLLVTFYVNLVGKLSWVSGWLPLSVACGIIVLRHSKALFGAALIAGLVFAILRTDFIIEAYEAEMAGGSDERAGLWEQNLRHVVNHPLFGMGPAGYAIYNMTYHPDDARSTHNNYFDILAQTGVIGFAAFLATFAAFLRTGWRVMQRLKGRGDFQEAYAVAAFAGCVGALVGMMLGDWVLPFAYNQTISGFDNAVFTWIFLGGNVALFHVLKDDSWHPAGIASR